MVDLNRINQDKRLPERLRIIPPEPDIVPEEVVTFDEKPERQEEKGKPADYFVPVDDSIGKISDLVLSFYSGSNKGTRNSYAKIYADLIIKLARVYEKQDPPFNIIVVNPDNDPLILNRVHTAIQTLAEFTGSIIPGDPFVKFNTVNPQQNGLPIWIQDYFLTFQQNGKRANAIRILENATGKFNDNDAANTITRQFGQHRQTKLQLDHSDLPFTGGNILFVGGYALVGYDNLFNKLGEIMPEEQFLKTFAKLTGIPKDKIILLGAIEPPDASFFEEGLSWLDFPTRQPLFHLDLFITPAGTVQQKGEKKYRLLIGDPVCHYHPYPKLLNFSKKVVEHFIDKLSQIPDFCIYRNPLPLTYIDYNDGKQKKRKWFFASYNNCLVQFTEDGNKKDNYVFLPTYGSDYSSEYSGYKNTRGGDWSELALFDQYNKSIWESLDFQVISLTNYLPLAEHRGAVRCITKVLQRQ